MLGILLFNAGFSVSKEHLKALQTRPTVSLLGIFGKSLLAIFWIGSLLMALTLDLSSIWISMLAGFAIVSIMPVATSSTAWSQQTNANVALSLGLLLLTTAMLPVILPILDWMIQHLPADLKPGAGLESTKSFDLLFIFIWIILPIFSGQFFRLIVGSKYRHRVSAGIKWINAINLLLLNYMHGSSFLPERIRSFEPASMLLLLMGVSVCCILAFGVGAILGKAFRIAFPEKLALMFGTGMNNNGMALVLASQFLGASGWIGLTIALCTFGQHLVAAGVQILFGKSPNEVVHETAEEEKLSKPSGLKTDQKLDHRHKSQPDLLTKNTETHHSAS